MVQLSDLKTGSIVKFSDSTQLYGVDHIGSNYFVIKWDKNTLAVGEENFRFYHLVKPKHKIYYRLYQDHNGSIFTVSSLNTFDKWYLRNDKMIAEGVVEVEEGQGL